jgi:methionine sulfoxide reductase heme-binding subunit
MAQRIKLPIWLFIATPLISALVIGATFLHYGWTDEGLRLSARYTVRVGLPLFLAAYTASALAHFFPSDATRWLRRNRRYLGINFAVAHFIHLGAVIMFFRYVDEPLDIAILLGGGLAYVLLGLMALTSNNWSVQKLGRNWRRLHLVGSHYLWAIFFFSYLGRLSDTNREMIGVIGLIIIVPALLLRIAAAASKRKAHQKTS